jgi:hypothetical protein
MSEMTFTKTLIKKEIISEMEKADSSRGEYDFLSALNSIRNRAVYKTKVITDLEFDLLCEEILEVE